MSLRPRRPSGFSVGLVAGFAIAAASLPGCAYYNTFYHAKKFYNQAQKVDEEERERSRNAVAQQGAQRADQSQGLYNRTIDKCEKVLEQHPKSRWADDAQFLMARAFYGKGDFIAARRELDRLRVRFPKSNLLPKVYFWEGLNAYAQEDYDDARGAWGRLLEEQPKYEDREEIEFYLAEALRRERRFDEAQSAYETFLEKYAGHEQSTRARLNLGEMLLEQDRYEEAQAVFELVTRRGREKDDRIEARKRLGEAFEFNRQHEEALSVYTDLAYEIDPGYLGGRMTAAEREAIRAAELEALALAELDSTLNLINPGVVDSTRLGPDGLPIDDLNNPGNDDPNDPSNQNNQNPANPNTPGGFPNPNAAGDPLAAKDPNAPRNNQQGAQTGGQRRTALRRDHPYWDDLAQVLIREGRVLAASGRPWDGILAFEQVVAEYERTELAAEAQYRIGYTYEVYLDDYAAAQQAYGEVGIQSGRSSFAQDAGRRAQSLKNLENVSAVMDDSTSAVTDEAADARFLRAELYLFQQDKPQEALEEYIALQKDFAGTDHAAKAALAEAWTRFHALADTARGRAKYAEVMRRFPDTSYGQSANRFLKGPEREPGASEFYGPTLEEILSPENLAVIARADSAEAARAEAARAEAAQAAAGAGQPPGREPGLVPPEGGTATFPPGNPLQDAIRDSAAIAASMTPLDPVAAPEGRTSPPERGFDPTGLTIVPVVLDLLAVPEDGPSPIAGSPLPGAETPLVDAPGLGSEVEPIEGLSLEAARAFFDSLTVSGDSLTVPADTTGAVADTSGSLRLPEIPAPADTTGGAEKAEPAPPDSTQEGP